MSKPRLSTGRIPFQLGVSTDSIRAYAATSYCATTDVAALAGVVTQTAFSLATTVDASGGQSTTTDVVALASVVMQTAFSLASTADANGNQSAAIDAATSEDATVNAANTEE